MACLYPHVGYVKKLLSHVLRLKKKYMLMLPISLLIFRIASSLYLHPSAIID